MLKHRNRHIRRTIKISVGCVTCQKSPDFFAKSICDENVKSNRERYSAILQQKKIKTLPISTNSIEQFVDIGEIYTRLFDNRPFLTGEIVNFVKEFEEKRQDREIEGLFTALQNTIENRDSSVEKFRLASEVHLSDIKTNLDSVKSVLDSVLEDNPTEDLNKTLEENRAKRQIEWQLFVDDMAHSEKNSKMSKVSIKDPSIKLKPSEKLIEFIVTLRDEIELPENLWKIIENQGGKSGQITTEEVAKPTFSKDEINVLNDLPKIESEEFSLNGLSLDFDDSGEESDEDIVSLNSKPASKSQILKQKRLQKEKQRARLTINLNDVKWLNKKLTEKRNVDADFDVYLNELLSGSRLMLPKNEILERNPELEARCVRLRLEQEARVYNAMTKNVDSSRTKLPEDTISYQIKQINRQLIAVAQFIFSIAAGFAFGFIGVELIVGNLDFGFRLMLGIFCALIIALAEIYFLAKKLNEDYDMSLPPKVNVNVTQSVINETGGKEHFE
ncbi:Transmembrane protein [Pseudolycoriella hygida]|uniref:Biogenesis of lysosome-related organelles complex 1 subunit 5 n=1 Tax=Pseudolycoriella hygida TaxID=35572 RepID=A0A9Q0N0D6_9DIPT|nr:Transmembrane protein [Pseudolycoriella hygida]